MLNYIPVIFIVFIISKICSKALFITVINVPVVYLNTILSFLNINVTSSSHVLFVFDKLEICVERTGSSLIVPEQQIPFSVPKLLFRMH